VRRFLEERWLIHDEHSYIAHPHLARLTSGVWALIANRAPRRIVTMHPPQDPEFVNVLITSSDEGASWTPPCVVPAYGWSGLECAGLTALADGGLLVNQWRFRWYSYRAAPSEQSEPLLREPAALRQSLLDSSELDSEAVAGTRAEAIMPWARGGGEAFVHRSDDGARTWRISSPIVTAPYSGGYGMRGGVVFDDGEILLPLSDVPHYERIFLVRSRDGGASWGRPEPVAETVGHAYEEPAPVLLANGRVVMLLRENVSRTLYSLYSDDRGVSWSKPQPTGIACYPAHVLSLADGRLVAVAGRRMPPFGISLFVSADHGRRWQVEQPVVIRTDLPNRDLGYPTAVQRSDGSLFVAYYYRDRTGVTAIYGATMVI
jgi:hypothetical protein